jgi:demethylmenaquinone methyltransferase/2-methoxy-6-polyprenyl-1,4-benzoquinol methylase
MTEHHFGFTKVSRDEKTKRVQSVFSNVANSYDVMNDAMSLGLHRLWKRHAILISNIQRGQTVLDLAGGTGDLTKLIQKRVGVDGQVVLADLNREMLTVGRDRLLNKGISEPGVLQLNAEQLPFLENSFDHIIMSFGFRNMTAQDKVLQETLRVLKPGGQLMIMEFSKVNNPVLEKVYDMYSFHIVPKIGEVIAKDRESYQYLVESIRMHPDQKTLENNMKQAGFTKVSHVNFAGGVVAIHRGYK